MIKSVKAKPHTPPYKIHRYFARRPWNVFQQIIEEFSKEGEIILDPFCGGGVTIYEGLRLKRKVIGFDLNPLSIFITKNMIKKFEDLVNINNTYQKISDYILQLYVDFDKLPIDDDQPPLFGELHTIVEWNELAHEVICNYCGNTVLLSNENKIRNGLYSCSNEKCEGNKKNGRGIRPIDCQRTGYRYLYSVIKDNTGKRLHVPFNSSRAKKIKEHVDFLKKECTYYGITVPQDKIPLDWDRQKEDLLQKKNINYFQDLFTERNLLLNLLILNFIKSIELTKENEESGLKEMFRLVFSSSLRDTNIMAFANASWQSGKPASWSKHAYWIPSQFCENNVYLAFEKAYNRIRKSIEYNAQFDYLPKSCSKLIDLFGEKNIYLAAESIEEANMPENFVDVIITDPPYGSNVQYLELSHFWHVWNKDVYGKYPEPDFQKEAVANRKNNFTGAKSFYDYEENLYSVFAKCYCVLKPNKHMILTFNNKDLRAWFALLISIFRAGFSFEKDGLIYQPGVKNYKQTAHTKYKGSPYGDFIHIFTKPAMPSKKQPVFSNQLEFASTIDSVFSRYLFDFKKSEKDMNTILSKMFLETIPIVEDFVNSQLFENHSVYSIFSKDYLEGFYHSNDGKS